MSAILDHYRDSFKHLRTDASRARWSAATSHRAPHKTFLLLSVMDMVSQGLIRSNLIQLDADLMDAFDLYWVTIMGQARKGNPVLPFWHLQSESFWRLVPAPDMEGILAVSGKIDSIARLRRLVLGAKVDDALFALLLEAEHRDALRRVLIERYFAPEIRANVVEIGHIAVESFEYSRELLDRLRRRFSLEELPELDEQYRAEARSMAFRRIIAEAYDHACALCGIRLRTPEGHTAVAAAHIVPWSISHNDDPRNGLALCGLHHWAFDEGLVTVAPDHHVVISKIVPRDDSAAMPLLALASSKLRRPADYNLHPADEACEWHRRKVFRA